MARAAVLLALLSLEGESVHDFQERRLGGSRSRSSSGVGTSGGHSGLNVLSVASAALLCGSSGVLASTLGTLEFALGLSTVGGLGALLEAAELLANRLALGFRGGASGVANRGLADCLALGASLGFALISRAADGANGALAVNHALGAGSLFALHVTLGGRANRVADGRALGVIALPSTLRVALSGHGSGEEGEQNDEGEFHHGCW